MSFPGKLARTRPGWEVISWALVITAPLSLAGTWFAWDTGISNPDAGALTALLYLSLGSMFAGFIFWNWGMAIGGIARVGQVQLLQSFVTLGLSALLLGETVTPGDARLRHRRGRRGLVGPQGQGGLRQPASAVPGHRARPVG